MDDILCPRCRTGRLSIDYVEGDTLKTCDECGMVFDVSYFTDEYKCQ